MENRLEFLNQEIIKVDRDYGESSLSVEEVLKIPIFKGYQVLGGHKGLENRCRHLTILETPEGIEWLKGGEFLLSAGYALKDSKEALKNAMVRSHMMKVSAIAIKEKRYIKEIPREMIELADEYSIPLIKLPFSLIYTEAVSSFYESLFYKKNEYLLQLKNMHEKLLSLVFENEDMKGAADVLSALTGSSITVFDSVFNLLTCSLYNDKHEKMLKKLIENPKMFFKKTNQLDIYTDLKHENFYINLFPILSNNKIIGYVYAISDSLLNNLSRNAIEHGRMILSLKMDREENDFLREISIKKAIAEIILNGRNLPDEFYYNIIDSYNWNNRDKFLGIFIKVYNNDENSANIIRFKNHLYTLLSRVFSDEEFLISIGNDNIFIFYSTDSTGNVRLVTDKFSIFTANFDKRIHLSFGVSRICRSIKDMPKAHNECYIASLFNREGDVLYYDSLDTIRLLYPLRDDKQVLEQYMKTINALKEYDAKSNNELLSTLETYFKYDMNKQLTSGKLHIHTETLRYRLNKIESITGYSLKTSEGIFILQMNLKLGKIIDIN